MRKDDSYIDCEIARRKKEGTKKWMGNKRKSEIPINYIIIAHQTEQREIFFIFFFNLQWLKRTQMNAERRRKSRWNGRKYGTKKKGKNGCLIWMRFQMRKAVPKEKNTCIAGNYGIFTIIFQKNWIFVGFFFKLKFSAQIFTV